jgi:2,3-dihydroxybenzoate-AMP ligase
MLPNVVRVPPEFAARYRARGYWEDQPLATRFRETFRRHGPRIAVQDGERSFTYADLDQASDALALNLLELGLQPLDRVVVQLPNTAEFVILYFALQKIGVIPVLALPAHRFLEINQFVGISGAVACVTLDRAKDVDFREMVRRIRKSHTHLRHHIVLGEALEDGVDLRTLLARPPSLAPARLSGIPIDPDDPAVFLLSGGTTGIPKLIPRTHNDYLYNSRMAASVCAIEPDSALLLVLPIAHNLPLACPGLQGFLMAGARVVMSRETNPSAVFALVEKHRITHIHLVPALLIRWLHSPELDRHDLRSLRILQSGGQRLQPETRALARQRLPQAFVQENFGMAEGVLMFVRLDDPPEVRNETVGRPICPDDEIRIVDDDDVEVPVGEVGEFCCRGPYTLRGYYNAAEHNARAFTPDGFYRSGDLMRKLPNGNYVVEGRKKDLINRGGEKISAEEVENLILAHPAVQNVACVPVPDADLGERMCACLVLKPDARLTLDELCRFLLAHDISKMKLPERLMLLDDFPLSGFGKVSKKALAERAARMFPAVSRAEAS